MTLRPTPSATPWPTPPCVAPTEYPALGEEKHHVVLLDYGAKGNIIRSLQKRGCRVTAVPASTSAEDILAMNPDGIMLSNGPGDPAENVGPIAELKKAPGEEAHFRHLPGPPAAGAGCRRPDRQAQVRPPGAATSPAAWWAPAGPLSPARTNGYAVVAGSVPGGVERFVNANDGTCEGMDYPELNAFTVQVPPRGLLRPQGHGILVPALDRHDGGKELLPLNKDIKKVLVIGSGPIVHRPGGGV